MPNYQLHKIPDFERFVSGHHTALLEKHYSVVAPQFPFDVPDLERWLLPEDEWQSVQLLRKRHGDNMVSPDLEVCALFDDSISPRAFAITFTMPGPVRAVLPRSEIYTNSAVQRLGKSSFLGHYLTTTRMTEDDIIKFAAWVRVAMRKHREKQLALSTINMLLARANTTYQLAATWPGLMAAYNFSYMRDGLTLGLGDPKTAALKFSHIPAKPKEHNLLADFPADDYMRQRIDHTDRLLLEAKLVEDAPGTKARPAIIAKFTRTEIFNSDKIRVQ
jgi:hypothetical protein